MPSWGFCCPFWSLRASRSPAASVAASWYLPGRMPLPPRPLQPPPSNRNWETPSHRAGGSPSLLAFDFLLSANLQAQKTFSTPPFSQIPLSRLTSSFSCALIGQPFVFKHMNSFPPPLCSPPSHCPPPLLLRGKMGEGFPFLQPALPTPRWSDSSQRKTPGSDLGGKGSAFIPHVRRVHATSCSRPDAHPFPVHAHACVLRKMATAVPELSLHPWLFPPLPQCTEHSVFGEHSPSSIQDTSPKEGRGRSGGGGRGGSREWL